jgi:hypothetical protein
MIKLRIIRALLWASAERGDGFVSWGLVLGPRGWY